MSGYRNRLLVKLSQSNKQHHNNSSCTTMASELNSVLNEKENITGINKERPGINTSYDCGSIEYDCSTYAFDSRNISPLIPLSESQINECIADNLGGDVNYVDLLPVPASSTNQELCKDLSSQPCAESPSFHSDTGPVINVDAAPSSTSNVECLDTSSAVFPCETLEETYSPPVKRCRDPNVKIWFQNRRTKWKKKDNVTNAEVAEMKQQNKPEDKKEPSQEDPLALDMSRKNCNKLLSEKLRNTKVSQVLPKPRKVEKGVTLETICDSNDIESRISITKITNKLSSTDLSGDGKVSVKSFNPEEVKEMKFDSLSNVEM
ncbi:hypothetical protein B5X24_HaOG206092 [Helicoverpa armigera]|uniref:Homeobox domain-containing protein n=1 Tax=Helicoverpa armigera TaxID=29058 RepID=A0A2W1BUJ6_HELAM|nr:hypothetical protein B5X24_HaOG206092 [Helicoverpa armigera]